MAVGDFLVDDDGNRLVDSSGNWIVHNTDGECPECCVQDCSSESPNTGSQPDVNTSAGDCDCTCGTVGGGDNAAVLSFSSHVGGIWLWLGVTTCDFVSGLGVFADIAVRIRCTGTDWQIKVDTYECDSITLTSGWVNSPGIIVVAADFTGSHNAIQLKTDPGGANQCLINVTF